MHKIYVFSLVVVLAGFVQADDRRISMSVGGQTDAVEQFSQELEGNLGEAVRSNSLYSALWQFFKQVHAAVNSGLNIVTHISSSPISSAAEVATTAALDAIDGNFDGVVGGQDAQQAEDMVTFTIDRTDLTSEQAEMIDAVVKELIVLLNDRSTTLQDLQAIVQKMWEVLQVEATELDAKEVATSVVEAVSNMSVTEALSSVVDTVETNVSHTLASVIADAVSAFKTTEIAEDAEENIAAE